MESDGDLPIYPQLVAYVIPIHGVFGRWRGGEGLAYKTQTTAGLSFCVVAMVMAMVVTG